MPPLLPPIGSPQGQVRSLVQREWLDQARRALRDASVQDNPDAARILCYTNRTVTSRLEPSTMSGSSPASSPSLEAGAITAVRLINTSPGSTGI